MIFDLRTDGKNIYR